jgi:hypothetical protein
MTGEFDHRSAANERSPLRSHPARSVVRLEWGREIPVTALSTLYSHSNFKRAGRKPDSPSSADAGSIPRRLHYGFKPRIDRDDRYIPPVIENGDPSVGR